MTILGGDIVYSRLVVMNRSSSHIPFVLKQDVEFFVDLFKQAGDDVYALLREVKKAARGYLESALASSYNFELVIQKTGFMPVFFT